MSVITLFKTRTCAFFVLICPLLGHAFPQKNEHQADEHIQALYHTLDNMPKSDMDARLDYVSNHLLGKSYVLGALGEGAQGKFDQFPLYRTDVFDCETFVDTVLAIALADKLNTFQQCIRKIRYDGGNVNFIHRNHFTCLDWNTNNQNAGYIQDITNTVLDEKQHRVAIIANANIDKPAWYQHFTVDNIRIHHADFNEKSKQLITLKQEGQRLEKAIATTPYIPLRVLFNHEGQPNMTLFKQIPNASIIEIVRPNWDLTKEIGTHLNISHLGFVFWKKNKLIFRQASSLYGRTIDVPLIEYLHSALNSPTIRGINLHKVAPAQPLSEACVVNAPE